MNEIIKKESSDLINQIIEENDANQLQVLENKFKLNQRKKNLMRVVKLSDAIELADNEQITRLTVEPEGFKNDELLKYVDSTQKTIDSILQQNEVQPLIQINNNELHVNSSGLNRESRAKVFEIVQQILKESQTEGE